MKILITGATGFIGSWMCKKLYKEGHQIKVLCRSSSDLSELDSIEYEKVIGDITDLDSLISATKDVDSVFHLAGLVGYSKKARPLMEKVNVLGTQNVVNACTINNIEKMLYFSSVVAIGSSFDKKTVLNEESEYKIGRLNLGYFETKKKAEELVVQAYNENKLQPIIVNPTTVYGPGDSKKGSRKTQLKVAKGKFPFYSSGGVNVVSIHEVIEASYKAFMGAANPGERHILAGENITIKPLFDLIAKHAEVKPPHIYLPNPILHAIGKAGDALEAIGKSGPLNSENAWTATMYHWFDSTKAQKKLGLNVVSADECIKQSVDWMIDNNYL